MAIGSSCSSGDHIRFFQNVSKGQYLGHDKLLSLQSACACDRTESTRFRQTASELKKGDVFRFLFPIWNLSDGLCQKLPAKVEGLAGNSLRAALYWVIRGVQHQRIPSRCPHSAQ